MIDIVVLVACGLTFFMVVGVCVMVVRGRRMGDPEPAKTGQYQSIGKMVGPSHHHPMPHKSGTSVSWGVRR